MLTFCDKYGMLKHFAEKGIVLHIYSKMGPMEPKTAALEPPEVPLEPRAAAVEHVVAPVV